MTDFSFSDKLSLRARNGAMLHKIKTHPFNLDISPESLQQQQFLVKIQKHSANYQRR